MQTIRGIIHEEGDKGTSQLALGVRDSSLTIKVKIKTKKEKEELIDRQQNRNHIIRA
jgi:hypothetical protein